MTKKLIWRLREQPSSESLRELVKSGLLTKDEAREILFSSETEEERDKKSLESEIKFLRELVEKLSSGNNSRVVEIIREVEGPWRRYPWYGHYTVWCNATNSGLISTATNIAATTNTFGVQYATTNTSNFSDIQTF